MDGNLKIFEAKDLKQSPKIVFKITDFLSGGGGRGSSDSANGAPLADLILYRSSYSGSAQKSGKKSENRILFRSSYNGFDHI